MLYLRAMVASLCLIPVSAALVLQDEKPTDASADHGLKPYVKIDTNKGAIVLELDGEKAPISTMNFIQYGEDGYYKGTTFHRVMSNFMIQGGGMTAEYDRKDAGLRPGITNEWKNGLKNKRGTISMARIGNQPDSGTSQFFINVVDNDMLDQARDGAAYAVFGHVVEGMDVVDAIRDTPVSANPKLAGQGPTVPTEPIIIQDVTVVGKFDREGIKKKVEEAGAEKAKAGDAAKKDAVEALKKAEAEAGHAGTTTPSGLAYVDFKEGDGATPGPQDVAEVKYKGWFPNGESFDSGTYNVHMTGGVIQGWLETLRTMKVGGKRRVIIPPQLAYGERGRPGIPPNAVLIFDMELLSVQKAGQDE